MMVVFSVRYLAFKVTLVFMSIDIFGFKGMQISTYASLFVSLLLGGSGNLPKGPMNGGSYKGYP